MTFLGMLVIKINTIITNIKFTIQVTVSRHECRMSLESCLAGKEG